MSSSTNTQSFRKRFVYFYFNRNEPGKIKQVIPSHVQYWQAEALNDYLGGPFSDWTGGMIIFSAMSLQEATDIILQDPFILEDLIAQKWIKEWITE
jgi:uncharacterized protein